MSLQYRKSTRLGANTRLNRSLSGMSLSHRAGPLSVSTSGRASVRLAPGWSFRLGKNQAGIAAVFVLCFLVIKAIAWLVVVAARLAWLLLWTAWLPIAWTIRLLARLSRSRTSGSTVDHPS